MYSTVIELAIRVCRMTHLISLALAGQMQLLFFLFKMDSRSVRTGFRVWGWISGFRVEPIPAAGNSRSSPLMACVSSSSCWLPASLIFLHLQHRWYVTMLLRHSQRLHGMFSSTQSHPQHALLPVHCVFVCTI